MTLVIDNSVLISGIVGTVVVIALTMGRYLWFRLGSAHISIEGETKDSARVSEGEKAFPPPVIAPPRDDGNATCPVQREEDEIRRSSPVNLAAPLPLWLTRTATGAVQCATERWHRRRFPPQARRLRLFLLQFRSPASSS